MKTVKFKVVYIEITNVCNKNCSFCPKTSRDAKFMSVCEFERVINQIKPYTNFVYLHIMGEPLMHPLLSEFLKIAKNNGIFVNLTTNGTLLLQKLDILKNNIRQINISLHSFEEDDEQKFAEYLNNALSAVKILSAGNVYISLRLWTCGENTKTRYLQILDGINKTFNCNIENVCADKKYKILHNIFLNTEVEFCWPNTQDAVNPISSRCRGAVDMLGVLAGGEVVLCCLDNNANTALGNIFESDLKNIIETDEFNNIANNFKNCVPTLELCKKCTFRNRFVKKG